MKFQIKGRIPAYEIKGGIMKKVIVVIFCFFISSAAVAQQPVMSSSASVMSVTEEAIFRAHPLAQYENEYRKKRFWIFGWGALSGACPFIIAMTLLFFGKRQQE